jgi:hypothetical protein
VRFVFGELNGEHVHAGDGGFCLEVGALGGVNRCVGGSFDFRLDVAPERQKPDGNTDERSDQRPPPDDCIAAVGMPSSVI